MSQCGGCGAEVVWIKTLSGKSMICDAQQVMADGANLGLVLVRDNGVIVRNPVAGTVGREPHWGKCPKAGQFRKKKNAGS